MKYAGLLLPILLAGCTTAEQNDAPPPPNIGMANPAAVYCQQKGGTSVPVQSPQGVRSDCKLPGGEVIDEWTLYRRDHKQS
ncbi:MULTISPECIES: DUF333 domain-containing protein [Scandinavium]|jgi:putative hemolysin|uniref:Hemolysin n=2 Tax=Scandinavium TaxID=2726810 RepID=A0A4R6EXJ4_SCAGO|nr:MULTISPECIES: DUF333 domain-containing protein [Scandinavium]MCS2153874.1 DUF333 domain-containing protein [Scandinavium goeteborgense]MCS2158711.1 DUF333 domain-containing protein [Scandinavium hiltneri]MCS2162937.1 DUF333 domain-containing protein [Scandinavium hiltneri]QKN82332.1 DUF333 domain-containing protein [Scandinavium goeteborgense]TDN64479.1 hypothetical protein EC847_101406 [Scandinavium goeteborgense]